MKKLHDPSHEFPKEQVRLAIQKGISQGEDQMNNKMESRDIYIMKKQKRKIVTAACGMAAAFGILIGASYYSPALASGLSQIPIIGSVFGDSNVIGLKQAQRNGLTNEIGETQTINGISITLDEILYDQNNITIGYIIEWEKELEEYYFGHGMDFTINGKLSNGSSGGYKENMISSTMRTVIQDINLSEDMRKTLEG